MTLAIPTTIPSGNPGLTELRSWLGSLLRPELGTLSLDARPAKPVRRVAGATDHDADAADVHAARAGDDGAFERIVRRHQQEVALRLHRFSHDPLVIEDLVQETFVQAFVGLRSYRADAPLIHWLHRIAVRTGYRYWTDRRSRPGHMPLEHASGVAASGESTPDALEGVLDRLSPRDRLVLTLMYLEDRSVEETAALTGWSRTMVKVQAHRARARLRKLMLRDGAKDRGANLE